MKTKAFLLLCCALLALAPSCRNRKTAPVPSPASCDSTAAASAAPAALAADPVLNGAARLLAGLPLAEGDPIFAMTQTPEWAEHRRKMDDMWAKSVRTLVKVDTLRRRELMDISDRAETVLYAFSGPDFPFVADFFPTAKNYVLLGLERTGSPIRADKVSGESYRKYQEALLWMLQKSYFVTSYMSDDLNNTEIDGTIPIFMVFIVRMGYEILSIDYQDLDADGVWRDADGHSRFVRIRFFAPGDTEARTLYYLSTDISNKKFDPRVQAMLQRLDPSGTAAFVKSCSYCLHYGSFSQIREIILDRCFALVQDDTGITYKTLLSRGWDVSLYGSYTEPIDLFPRSVYQAGLDEAYRALEKPRPLGFRFGYNYKGSSLIVARRP